LSVASAAWTIGPPLDAVRWGLVIAGYAALVISGGVVGRDVRGLHAVACGLAVVAAATATAGLAGVIARATPWAERLRGQWVPGGLFEYSSVLAVVQVAALPVLLTAMVRARTPTAAGAAAGAAMAGAVLGLAGSRFALVTAAVVVLIALAAPGATVGASRAVVAAAAALLGVAAVAAHLLVGGSSPVGAGAGSGSRLAALGAIVVGAAVLWPVVRGRPLRSARWDAPLPRGSAAGLAVCGCVIAVAAGAGAGSSLHPLGTTGGTGPGGITHGRVPVWKAGMATAAKRPILGSGADTFLQASRHEQTRGVVRYAFNLPIELAAELGVPGLALALALFGACAAALWRARGSPALWLLGPGIGVFLLFNLLDWSWHVAAAGGLWAIALGAVCGQSLGDRPARE
jgi:hypothetical protein